jgi:hypothetical protein
VINKGEGMDEDDIDKRTRDLLTSAIDGLMSVGAKAGTPIDDSAKEIHWGNKKLLIWANNNPPGMDFRFFTDDKLTAAIALSPEAAYYLSNGISIVMEENMDKWNIGNKGE